MQILMRPATVDDAVTLAPYLREADKRELEAGDLGIPVVGRLAIGIGASTEAIAMSVDGQSPDVLCGVLDGIEARVVWMVCTDYIVEHAPIALLKLCKELRDRWYQEERKPLICAIDRRNHQHQRWLRRLGFRDSGKTIMRSKLPFDLMYYKPLILEL